jgi:uncharacterized protein
MLINLSELFTLDGKEKDYTAEIDMNLFHGPTAGYPFVSKEPVHLHVKNLGDRKLLITGNMKFSLNIPCDRCLEPVEVPFDLEIENEADLSKTDEERLDDLDEQPYISGYNLDVEQLLSNELLLNLPMKVLCKEDCKGICNRCGTNLNYSSCDCDRSSPDPRMSVIQDIFKQFKEV